MFSFSATNALVFTISTAWNDPTNTILFLRLHKESQYVFKADVFNASKFCIKRSFSIKMSYCKIMLSHTTYEIYTFLLQEPILISYQQPQIKCQWLLQ